MFQVVRTGFRRATLAAMKTWTSVREGIRLGVTFAIAYSAVATAVYVVSAGAAFRQQGLSYWATMAAYFLGGATTGAVGGLLRPLGKTSVRAFVIGVIASVPTCGLLTLALVGLGDREALLVVTMIGSFLLGGPCGIVVREIFKEDPPSPSEGADT